MSQSSSPIPQIQNSPEEENHCKYVSSYGLIKSCEIRSYTPQFCRFINYNFDIRRMDMPDYTVIYVSNADMRSFFRFIGQIQKKFILVSGDADEVCPDDILSPDEFQTLLSCDKLVHWYSQNCMIAREKMHPKMSKIPIGLDYHSISRGGHSWGKKKTPLQQEIELDQIAEQSKPINERQMKCYSNFHFSIHAAHIPRFVQDRIDAIEQISRDLVYYEPKKIPRVETFKHQCEFVFVISPHGNGNDCHRTWESLVLGNIVIVKTSHLDDLYEGLPVWIVKEWNEVTEENMRRIYREYVEEGRLFDSFEKLKLSYWREKIYKHKVFQY